MRDVLQTRRLFGIMAVLLTAILLTACGTGDSDEDPTATSAASDAQPTVAAEETTPEASAESAQESASSIPTNVDMSTATFDATPAATAVDAVATPADESVVMIDAATPEIAVAATPGPDMEAATPISESETTETVVSASGTPDPDASPVSVDAIPAAPGVGDGTTGAMIAATPGVEDISEVATPIAAGTAETATPGASPAVSASPAASVMVTGCDVPVVPAFEEEQTFYTLTTDLNFRTGPGAECDLALEDPIGEFQTVEVIGGPVVREDDGSEWVQLRVNDTEGWVVFEFLEPVED